MRLIRLAIFRGFLLISFMNTFLYFLYGQERGQVRIERNAAWNDLVRQIDPVPENPTGVAFGKEMAVIQKFLREHRSEGNVGIYDVEVFRAIDQVRARLQRADKDMEIIRNELSYKEQQVKRGR